jgi:hypothetical protein
MSKQNQAKDKFFASAEMSEKVKGNLDENDSLHEHTGFVTEDDKIDLISEMATAYHGKHPEMPNNFADSKLGTILRKHYATKLGSKAVKNGNVSQIKFLTGMQSYQNDASSIQSIMNLENRIGNEGSYVAYMFATMGAGKTSFASLMGEIAKRRLNYEIGSNIRSIYDNSDSDAYFYTFGDFLKWLAEGVEIEQLQDIERMDIDLERNNKLFIFDEASNYASGYSGDSHDTQEKLGKTIKLVRKVGGSMIIIGHTGKDIHPDIRRLTDDIIFKKSKKVAEFYEDVENAEPKNLKHKESGIPDSNWDYDTNEITFWSWENVTSDELAEMEKGTKSKKEKVIEVMKENPQMTQNQIADKVDCQQSYVSQVQAEIKKEIDKQ